MLKLIHCKSCGAGIPEERIDRARKLVVCAYCSAIYEWKEPIPPDSSDRPLGMVVVRRQDYLFMRFQGVPIYQKFEILFFVIILDLIALMFLSAFLAVPKEFLNPCAGLILLVIPAALWMTLYVIRLFVNTSQLLADRQSVNYIFGPIALGPASFMASDIRQVYVMQEVRYTINDNTSYVFNVYLILADGSRKKFITGLSYPDYALYIEKELESFLNIKNAKVMTVF